MCPARWRITLPNCAALGESSRFSATKKLNPRIYGGKDRIYTSIPKAPRISRLWVWDELAQEYISPVHIKFYMAKRYDVGVNGKRRRVVQFFFALEEARKWQVGCGAQKKDIATSGIAISFDDDSPFFGEIIKEWKRRRYPQLALGTRNQYDKIVELYLGSLLPLRLRQISSQRVDEWLDELKSPKSLAMKRVTRQSFDHELTLLTTVLRYYFEYHEPEFQFPIKRRHREAIQLKGRAIPSMNKNLPEEKFLKFREQLRGLKNGQMWAALATAQYYQALRISEAAGLYWEDAQFDFDALQNSRLIIVRSVYWPHKKGQPSFVRIGFKNAEANGGVKELPMFPETFRALMSRYEEGARGLVFHINGEHLDYKLFQYTYNRAFRLAGLPYTSTHIMRHGGCRRLLNREHGDLGVAQQLLGNSSLKTTLVYAKRDAGALTAVVQKDWENELKNGDIGCKWLREKPQDQNESRFQEVAR